MVCVGPVSSQGSSQGVDRRVRVRDRDMVIAAEVRVI